MEFNDAFTYLRDGYKITRDKWSGNVYLQLVERDTLCLEKVHPNMGDVFVLNMGMLFTVDILAKDWSIYIDSVLQRN